MTLDDALDAALRADTDGVLHAALGDLASLAMKLSCAHGRDPERKDQSGELLKLALELRGLIMAKPEQVAARTRPSKPGHTTRRPQPGRDIAGRLESARDTIRRESRGRLRSSATDPADLWCQLHLGSCWLDEAMMTECRKLLREAASGEPAADYLIPPLPELEVDGVDWTSAEQHPRLIEAITAWEADQRSRLRPLLRLAGITFTLVDRYACLYAATGGRGVKAIAGEPDRADYQQRMLSQLRMLADPRLTWPAELEWLVEADGTIRSVFPLPFPAPSSWWAIQLRGSFDMIAARAAEETPAATVILPKSGIRLDSDEYQRYAGKDSEPIAPQERDEAGKVLWPLRAYLSLPAAAAGRSPIIRPARVAYGHTDGFVPEPAQVDMGRPSADRRSEPTETRN